ncbi:MAG TPA: hypothetical protein PKD53_02725 [Chloroflexaceae bacterium]|nr:hypothetical protein [Chloroflexaceae bacterium]
MQLLSTRRVPGLAVAALAGLTAFVIGFGSTIGGIAPRRGDVAQR